MLILIVATSWLLTGGTDALNNGATVNTMPYLSGRCGSLAGFRHRPWGLAHLSRDLDLHVFTLHLCSAYQGPWQATRVRLV